VTVTIAARGGTATLNGIFFDFTSTVPSLHATHRTQGSWQNTTAPTVTCCTATPRTPKPVYPVYATVASSVEVRKSWAMNRKHAA
jgi:hypothetical protein